MAIFKYDEKEHLVRIDNIDFFNNEIRIRWSSPTLGVGEYKIWKKSEEKFVIDSEYMDSANLQDLSFLECLFQTFIKEFDISDF